MTKQALLKSLEKHLIEDVKKSSNDNFMKVQQHYTVSLNVILNDLKSQQKFH